MADDIFDVFDGFMTVLLYVNLVTKNLSEIYSGLRLIVSHKKYVLQMLSSEDLMDDFFLVLSSVSNMVRDLGVNPYVDFRCMYSDLVCDLGEVDALSRVLDEFCEVLKPILKDASIVVEVLYRLDLQDSLKLAILLYRSLKSDLDVSFSDQVSIS